VMMNTTKKRKRLKKKKTHTHTERDCVSNAFKRHPFGVWVTSWLERGTV
jgi:ribosomal protein L37AE/L43A